VERDFSIAVYEELLAEIVRTGRQVLALREYFGQRQGGSAFFILRHDVDRRPSNALKMARLEDSLGIHSTYYFRVNRRVFKADIIREIAELGHEVGYHYEVLDKAHGKVSLAERIFVDELDRLREVTEVSTACMHGNPLSPWDNRDFWKHYALSQFGLVGEAYISVRERDLCYVTDTGRAWNRGGFNLRDHFPEGWVSLMPSLAGTRQLILSIRKGEAKKIYLQVHPNRWSWNRLEWHVQWGEDLLFNGAKWFIMRYRKKRSQT
jgi:hypothetical protein